MKPSSNSDALPEFCIDVTFNNRKGQRLQPKEL